MNGVAMYCHIGKTGGESGFSQGGAFGDHDFCFLHVKFEMPETSR